ncbi:MAG: 4Fe-4S dicluster domain-containing protein [Thermoleophilia bacterium]|jgi:heterodisulfide reductase subunit C|nr:4Fe-4S dicluster domain-containing protein [Actinomycetota bacterium]MCL6092497.1 4Fe-4S dicluster domain-containing protein [Actinomycetota bacterium]MDA8167978.1 4Fe-4S dicluster domain-containing protein [Actinomycetota bacterium]
MINLSRTVTEGAPLVAEIERRSGQRVSACLQCGRCTSTCVAAHAFDFPPHRLMHMLQIGLVQEVLASRTAQLCLDCMTCSMRCPMKIDVAGVIETAKAVADEAGLRDTERDLRLFRREFLRNVRRHGRLHETSMLLRYNFATRKLTNDISLVPLILRKRKVHLFPPKVKNLRQMRRIFREINGDARPAPEPETGAGE